MIEGGSVFQADRSTRCSDRIGGKKYGGSSSIIIENGDGSETPGSTPKVNSVTNVMRIPDEMVTTTLILRSPSIQPFSL